jgi:hypothetical protein
VGDRVRVLDTFTEVDAKVLFCTRVGCGVGIVCVGA